MHVTVARSRASTRIFQNQNFDSEKLFSAPADLNLELELEFAKKWDGWEILEFSVGFADHARISSTTTLLGMFSP
eukprot:COSAG02_NODE_2266_length_9286_cov_2.788723_10_plen_75_part_00